MKKKIIFLLILLILLTNISIVSSSWYDWSRYEVGIYSFKIPEGFELNNTESVQPTYYLAGDIGNITIYVDNESLVSKFNDKYDRFGYYPDTKEILEYNETTSFYSVIYTSDYYNVTSYWIFGEYKITIDNQDIYLNIKFSPREYDEETIEKSINIMEGMFESMEVNR